MSKIGELDAPGPKTKTNAHSSSIAKHLKEISKDETELAPSGVADRSKRRVLGSMMVPKGKSIMMQMPTTLDEDDQALEFELASLAKLPGATVTESHSGANRMSSRMSTDNYQGKYVSFHFFIKKNVFAHTHTSRTARSQLRRTIDCA